MLSNDRQIIMSNNLDSLTAILDIQFDALCDELQFAIQSHCSSFSVQFIFFLLVSFVVLIDSFHRHRMWNEHSIITGIRREARLTWFVFRINCLGYMCLASCQWQHNTIVWMSHGILITHSHIRNLNRKYFIVLRCFTPANNSLNSPAPIVLFLCMRVR